MNNNPNVQTCKTVPTYNYIIHLYDAAEARNQENLNQMFLRVLYKANSICPCVIVSWAWWALQIFLSTCKGGLKDESCVPYESVAPLCELWMNDRRDTKCAK